MSPSQMAGAALASAVILAAASADARVLEQSTQAFVDGLPKGPPIYTLSPAAARDVLSSVQKSAKVTLAPVTSQDRALPLGPTGRTNIRVLPYNPVMSISGHAKSQNDFNKKRSKPPTIAPYTGSERLYADILNTAPSRRLIKYKLYH